MQVWRSIGDIPSDLGATVVTIGNFDGVHRGHRAVLSCMAADAKARGMRAVAITFDPHPREVHDPDHPPVLITGVEDRLERLGETGLDGVLLVRYTLDFAMQTPEEFVRNYLVDALGAAVVVVGQDTKFGRGNAGDVETLEALGEQMGFVVEVLPDAGDTDARGRRWSSTWVRELLDGGRVREAAEVLGSPHRVRGVIVHGDKRGRTIGYPTANLAVTSGMIPRHGVYAGWLTVLDAKGNPACEPLVGERMPAAISVGLNYTVGGDSLRVEAFVIDAPDLDLYDAEAAFDLIDWRRPMLDFGSLEALTDALAEDVAWSRHALGIAVPQ